MLTSADVRRKARLAVILRAARKSNPAPGRQVVTEAGAKKYHPLQVGDTIPTGWRALTEGQRAAVDALSPEGVQRYRAARVEGRTHAEALKFAGGKPAPRKAAAKKATSAKRVLWGSHPGYNGGQPMKLTGGTEREVNAEARRRQAEGWDVQVRDEGARPSEGFGLVAEQGGSRAVREADEKVRKAAEAEARATRARERAKRAQARLDAVTGQTAEERGLAEHFPLGVGGGGGGRRGASDARLAATAQAFRDRDRAQQDLRVAEAQAARLRAERDAAGKYSRETVRAGDFIKVKGSWERVQKANAKTVQIDAGRGMEVRYRWDQVTDHRPAAAVTSQAQAG